MRPCRNRLCQALCRGQANGRWSKAPLLRPWPWLLDELRRAHRSVLDLLAGYSWPGNVRGLINALERACVDYSTKRSGGATFSSRKSARIAVVGGGLSGLTAAFDLITKGFQVVLFEAGSQLAGRLRELGEEKLPQQWIDEDLAVLENVLVEVRLNTPVGGHAQTGPGLSAVIEDPNGVLSYWALRHPPGKPDFHHPDTFALEIDLLETPS